MGSAFIAGLTAVAAEGGTCLAETVLFGFLATALLPTSDGGEDAAEALVGFVVGVDGMCALACTPFFPGLVRRFGSSRVFLFALTFTAVCSVVTGPITTSCGAMGLATVRALAGGSGALGCCAGKVLVIRAFSDPATGSALVEGMEAITYILGPPLGGLIFTRLGVWAPSFIAGFLLLGSLGFGVAAGGFRGVFAPWATVSATGEIEESEMGETTTAIFPQAIKGPGRHIMCTYLLGQVAVSYVGPNIAVHLAFFTDGSPFLAGLAVAVPAAAFLATTVLIGSVVGTSDQTLVLGCVCSAVGIIGYSIGCAAFQGVFALVSLWIMGMGVAFVQVEALPCLLQRRALVFNDVEASMCASMVEMSGSVGDSVGAMICGLIADMAGQSVATGLVAVFLLLMAGRIYWEDPQPLQARPKED